MKENKYICVIATVMLAMLTSVSSAQSGTKAAIPKAISEAVPQTPVQDASSYVVGNTDSSMVVSEEIVPAQPAFETSSEIYGAEATGSSCCEPAPTLQPCDCREESCSRCRLKRKRPACGCKRRGCQGGCGVESTPMFQSCEGDFCVSQPFGCRGRSAAHQASRELD